jgi:hypothetical protein
MVMKRSGTEMTTVEIKIRLLKPADSSLLSLKSKIYLGENSEMRIYSFSFCISRENSLKT